MHSASKYTNLAALSAVTILLATPALADQAAPDASAPPAAMEQSQSSPDAKGDTIVEKNASGGDQAMSGPTVTLGQEVWSSDGKELGKVSKITLDAAGNLESIQFDVGSILGLGGKTVMSEAADFTLSEDRIDLKIDAEAANALPEIKI